MDNVSHMRRALLECLALGPAAPLDYPRLPFVRQQQLWPSPAGFMHPYPDRSETSYKDCGGLRERKALFTRGDSATVRFAAIIFAREGAGVGTKYLAAEEPYAREMLQLIRAKDRTAVALPGDIKDEAFCRHLVVEAARKVGGTDILLNNAEHQIEHDSTLAISTAPFDETSKTNLYVMFWLTKAALARMQCGAVIIRAASVNAFVLLFP